MSVIGCNHILTILKIEWSVCCQKYYFSMNIKSCIKSWNQAMEPFYRLNTETNDSSNSNKIIPKIIFQFQSNVSAVNKWEKRNIKANSSEKKESMS